MVIVAVNDASAIRMKVNYSHLFPEFIIGIALLVLAVLIVIAAIAVVVAAKIRDSVPPNQDPGALS